MNRQQNKLKQPVIDHNKIEVFEGDLSDERLAQHMGANQAYDDTIQSWLSVDCEMMGLNPHRDRLCLVQICDENGNISLIQIKNNQDKAPNLQKLLEQENITKLFHYGRADLAHLRYQLGILVNPVFCTKIASKLARTYTEKHGLKDNIREFLGIELNKYQQSSDWGRDYLTQEQIEYAACDVIYLIELKDKLLEVLEREGRQELAYQCFEQVALMAELDILGYDFLFEHRPPKQP